VNFECRDTGRTVCAASTPIWLSIWLCCCVDVATPAVGVCPSRASPREAEGTWRGGAGHGRSAKNVGKREGGGAGRGRIGGINRYSPTTISRPRASKNLQLVRQRVAMAVQKAQADVLINRLHHALPGCDGAEGRRDAQEDPHESAQVGEFAGRVKCPRTRISSWFRRRRSLCPLAPERPVQGKAAAVRARSPART
jgi:hypothetical protein